MSDNISFLTAFLFGFLGSIHCVGMCGGIITALSMKLLENKKRFYLYQLIYNTGRIISYGIVGVFVSIFGVFIFDLFGIDVKVLFKFFFPSILIFFGLFLLNVFKKFFFNLERFSYDFFNFLYKKIFRFLHFKSPLNEFIIGLLWGNMPCGLVYSVLSISLVSGSILKSFFLMMFFGLGTMPAVIFTGTFYSNIIIMKKKNFIVKILGILTCMYGFYFLFKSFVNNDCHLQQIIFNFS